MLDKKHISRRNFLWLTAGAGAAAMGACSGGSNGTSSGGGGGGSNGPRTLRYHAQTYAPPTLDPARGAAHLMGYDVMIYQGHDGSLQPRLAESWQYVGEGNTTFEVKLRPDLKFNDGTPVNADAVKANIEYRQDPAVGSQSAAHLAAVERIEIVDDLTVRVHLSEPNPLMPEMFSQGQGGPGALISPAALEKPDSLATATYGVGRYKLDPAGTVFGDHETWVPDPTYWNQDEVVWDKVVIHYMPEESAALAALQSGQLDAATVTAAVVKAGKQAGFAVTGPGWPIVLGLNLVDRAGAVTPALADVRVRQALNYAVDREKIVTALLGDSGVPTDQMSAPGHEGWSEEGFYPYDPDQARQLLADAGFADGFSFQVRLPNSEQHVRLTQAVADDLKQVGVELKLHSVPSNQFDQADDGTNRAYGAVYMGWGIEVPYRMAASFWLPNATNNTFDTVDDTLVDLQQQIATADEEARADLNRQVVARTTELAWFLPVALMGQHMLYNDDIVAVSWEDFLSIPNVLEARPA